MRSPDKKGLFEIADDGTLFLDEIGELDISLQAKDLARPAGKADTPRRAASRELDVDVRVVAATNRDLLHMVEEKRFREDLYYRLECSIDRVCPPCANAARTYPS